MKKIEEKINSFGDEIFNYTPQVFFIENEKTPRPVAIGSCILYQNEEKYYLITAKHVFSNYSDKKVGILIHDVFMEIQNIVICSDDKENKIDLAFLKLRDSEIEEIKKQYKFLDKSFIDLNLELSTELRYLMAGFPVSKTKIYGKTHKREEFILLSKPSSLDMYSKLDFEEKNHIIVDIKNPRDFKNPRYNTQLPNLYGVSGSGLWYLDCENFKFYLIAIMTEWHKSEKVTVGTHVKILVTYIENLVEDEYKKQFELLKKKHQVTS